MSYENGYKYTDKEMLDFLQGELDKDRYTGMCIFRNSTTGRGWRLHETSMKGSISDVRQALREGMDRQQEGLIKGE